MQKSQNRHKPPHYYEDNQIYFITASTYHKKPLFDDKKKKATLKSVIREKAELFGVKIFAFVLMDSHYHLLVKMKNGEDLAKFIKGVNGKSAILLNKMDGVTERPVWYNYWDSCIRGEKDFWARFNYIHHNPVKHGYATKMEEYEYSSYNAWLKKKGSEWMDDVLASYPIVDFTKGDK